MDTRMPMTSFTQRRRAWWFGTVGVLSLCWRPAWRHPWIASGTRLPTPPRM